MNTVSATLLRLLRKPATWVSLGIILAAAGISFTPGAWDAISSLGVDFVQTLGIGGEVAPGAE